MSIVYTHRGFPIVMDNVSSGSSVYESPEVSEIYRNRMEQTRPVFDIELDQIAVMAKEWALTGGFFKAALDPSVRLSSHVQSFIAETALFLSKTITRRRVSFQDRAMLIKQDQSVAMRLPTFTPVEREAIDELSQLIPEALIQMWVSRLGVDDLSQTLQLYVGDRTITSVQ